MFSLLLKLATKFAVLHRVTHVKFWVANSSTGSQAPMPSGGGRRGRWIEGSGGEGRGAHVSYR